MNEEFRKILKKLEINPQDESLYKMAFIHRSHLNEIKEVKQSNERIEFLGDCILSFVVSGYLYKTRPDDTEGDLTNLRAYMVKTDSLARAARQLHLGEYLKLSKGEEMSGGRSNPQILADTYEAVIGATFLDQGVDAASRFIKSTLFPAFENELAQGAPRDPKSHLQELAQSQFQSSPKYKILETTGPDHAKQFTVGVFVQGKQVGQGKGNNKQQAEEESAKEALTQLVTKNPDLD